MASIQICDWCETRLEDRDHAFYMLNGNWAYQEPDGQLDLCSTCKEAYDAAVYRVASARRNKRG